MLLLLIIMCGVCGLAFWFARRAGVNGWIGRYLLMMFVNSLAVTLPLIFTSVEASLYSALYVAALVPLLATIGVLAVGWLWKSEPGDRWLIVGACLLQCALTCSFLMSRAETTWFRGIPWQVILFIVQYGILSSAGIVALASEKFLDAQYRPIAHLLGTMWFVQAMEKALFVSGFAYHWQTWLELNRWLPAVIVILFMVGLLFKFKSFEFESLLQRAQAERAK